MTNSVENFFYNAPQWKKEMEALRAIAIACGLDESFKWNKPCYSHNDKNIVIIQGFKNYCALLFFKGVLLKNDDGLLVKTGVNTQVGRQARFTDVKDITMHAAALKACIYEAIAVETAGWKPRVKSTPMPLPAELKIKMKEMPAFKKAFEALTPGRQRGYIFYFSQAKQTQTRQTRIEKYMPKILKGKGLQD